MRAPATALLLAGLARGLRVPNSPQHSPEVLERLDGCLAAYADAVDMVREGLGDHVHALRNLTVAKTDDRKIVIGAGAGCTGTKSLKSALELLGMHGWHWDQIGTWTPNLEKVLKSNQLDSVQWDVIPPAVPRANVEQCHKQLREWDFTTVPDTVQFFLDQPSDVFFVHWFLSFPNAKFVLTTRPTAKWVGRRRTHLGSFAPLQDPCGLTLEDFQLDRDLARLLEMQNELVRCAVPADRVLEYSTFTDSNERLVGLMTELARFVERPLNEQTSFPHELFAESPLDEESGMVTLSSERGMSAMFLRPNGTLLPKDIGPLMQQLSDVERSLEYIGQTQGP